MIDARASARLRGWSRAALPLLATLAFWVAPEPALATSCKLKTIELPIRMVGDRPLTTVGLNGTEVTLLVDSGAFFSMLTESAARQLNLRLRSLPDNLRIYGLTGKVDARMTRVEKMQLAGAEVPGVEFIVGLNELGAGIQGVMGRNFLAIADTEYDLAHGIVRLVFPKGDCDDMNMAYWAGAETPVNVAEMDWTTHGNTAINVSVRINGHKARALMDTGAFTTLNLSAARRAGLKEADLTPVGRIGGAGSGHANAWTARIEAFELGGEKITNNRLAINDAGDAEQDMLIGVDYFLSHRIYVSRLQNKLYTTWNGGPVFALNKASDKAEEARYAVAPQDVPADDADALGRRGEAALSRGDLPQALEDLTKAFQLSPQTARYLVSRAHVYGAMHKPAEALKDLDQALSLQPALQQAKEFRAYLRAGTGDRAGALSDLEAVDQALAASAHSRAGMGDAYAELGLAAQALHQWDLWIASHPRDASLGQALNRRCRLRARLKLDLPLALQDCLQAVKEDKENAQFRDSLGWTYLRLDQPARAVKAFDDALDLRASYAWSLYGRAQAHRLLGHAEAARQDLAASRKLDPHIDDKVRSEGFDAEPDAPPTASASR